MSGLPAAIAAQFCRARTPARILAGVRVFAKLVGKQDFVEDARRHHLVLPKPMVSAKLELGYDLARSLSSAKIACY